MKQRKLVDPLEVQTDTDKGFIERARYAKSKLRALREFGYPDLTDSEIERQIDAVLTGKKFGQGLTVIGMFLENELAPERAKRAALAAKPNARND